MITSPSDSVSVPQPAGEPDDPGLQASSSISPPAPPQQSPPPPEPDAPPAAEPAPTADKLSKRAQRRAPLSRERMLTAALEVVDTEGLEALTMRRLARRLLKDPMALYRHATSRADLLDAVAGLVLVQWDIPTQSQDWREELRLAAHRLRQLALQHPHVVPLILTGAPSTPLGLRPPATWRPLEQILTLLTGAGLTPAQGLRVYRPYISFLHGHILTELQEVIVDPDPDTDLPHQDLNPLPPGDFPQIHSLAVELSTYDGAAELDRGLNLLLLQLPDHQVTAPMNSEAPTGSR